MNVTYVYGPNNIKFYDMRKLAHAFGEIPEPWKSYAMMLDAAADEYGYAKFSFCERQQATYLGDGTKIWYLFDINFWREHASLSGG